MQHGSMAEVRMRRARGGFGACKRHHCFQRYLSYSLNSLKGLIQGGIEKNTIGDVKGIL